MGWSLFRIQLPAQILGSRVGIAISFAWLFGLEWRAGIGLPSFNHLLLGSKSRDGLRDGLERSTNSGIATVRGLLRRRRLVLVLLLVRLMVLFGNGGWRRRSTR